MQVLRLLELDNLCKNCKKIDNNEYACYTCEIEVEREYIQDKEMI